MFEKILSILGSNVIDKVANVVDRFVTTKEEKELLKIEMQKILHLQEMEGQKFALEAEHEFNNRIKELEGTAKDLQQFGWIGRIVIFFRGLQRPLWGYGVAYMDVMVFSGKWMLEDQEIKSAFWVINFLVLGFLFGERAIKNVAPLIKEIIKK